MTRSEATIIKIASLFATLLYVLVAVKINLSHLRHRGENVLDDELEQYVCGRLVENGDVKRHDQIPAMTKRLEN